MIFFFRKKREFIVKRKVIGFFVFLFVLYILFEINISTWAVLATFLSNADLFAGWTGQWWTSRFCVEPLTSEATVVAVAFDALLR